MYCIIQFYVQMRKPLEEHRPFLKVLAIKLVVFLSFWQVTAVALATNERFRLFEPNDVIAYPDIKISSPAAILCVEMTAFAILHLWAYPYAPYVPGAKTVYYPLPDESKANMLPRQESVHQPPSGGILGVMAFVDAMNPWDFVKAFGRGMRWLFCGVKRRHQDAKTDRNERMSSWDLANLGNSNHTRLPGARSTEHLPIADQFRRSRFGISAMYDDSSGNAEDRDGLIAHAQPNPTSATAGWDMAASRQPDTVSYGAPSYGNAGTPWSSPPHDQHSRFFSATTGGDWEPTIPGNSPPRTFGQAY